MGVLGSGPEARVALRSPSAGRASWVYVGGTFEGFIVRSYDAASDMVVVAKGGAQFRVRMADSRVQPGKSDLPAPQRRRILDNLRRLGAAADQFYLENGVTRATYDQLVGPEKYLHQIVPVDGEDYRTIDFEQGKLFEVHTIHGLTITYDP